MKQLFWKERYEMRWLPPGAALAVAAVLIGIKAFTQYHGERFLAFDEIVPVIFGAWLLFGVLAGAGLFSQEIGTGTLQFLSSLPVPRRTVWWVKVGTALGALLLAVLGSALVGVALCAIWSPGGLTGGQSSLRDGTSWLGVLEGTGVVLFFLLNCLSIALAVSPFCDRSLIASVAATLACVGVDAAIFDVAGNLSHSGDGRLLFTLVGLTIPTFAMISYGTFTRGESLRSARRFTVAAKVGGACLAVWAVVVLIGRLLWLW